MYYTEEFNIDSFNFWGGAKSRINSVKELGKLYELEDLIIEVFGDREDVYKTDINDFVWFEDEMIDKYLGI